MINQIINILSFLVPCSFSVVVLFFMILKLMGVDKKKYDECTMTDTTLVIIWFTASFILTLSAFLLFNIKVYVSIFG